MYGVYDKDATPRSSYNPPAEEKAFVSEVHQSYNEGQRILTKPWTELNGRSVIADMNAGRRMFNAFVDDGGGDVAIDWRWRGTRSKARNKGLAMHANLTAGYLLPTFLAQNTDSQMDKGFSDFMTDLVEWMAQDENSDYKVNYLSLIMATESDPIVYLGAEYHEVMQKVKIEKEDGKFETKEILDEVMSGFKAPIYTADQILVSNAFERNLQMQRCTIKRKWIEYNSAEAKYREHPNFIHVQPGVQVFFNSDGLFYENHDDDHPLLVEEATYLNRREDTEVCFLGGIYMGEEDIGGNRFRHRDNFDAPRYDFQQFGYYPIGSHFLFYKSMMSALRWDNGLYDAMTEIAMNRAILDAEMPIAVQGSDKIDQDIIFPNSVVAMKDANSKVTPLLPASNLNNIFQALRDTEDSISESSVSDTIAGQLPAASQKAYSVAQAQANAKKIIGGVAKGHATSIARYGLLMKDIAITHLSVAQIDDLIGDSEKLRYRSFLLTNRVSGNQRSDKMLAFSDELVGKEMTAQEKRTMELNMYAESEKSGQEIAYANPELFAKFKYHSRADYREVFAQNDDQMQGLLIALYGQMANNPYANQEEITKELMYSYFHSKGDRFVKKPQPQTFQGAAPGQTGNTPNQLSQAIGAKQLSTTSAAAGVGA